ncbi:hypothetical protein GUJ93_ZPchr0010g8304 [Zizania palustris]|uniref:Replication protein A OB domain-containing protein n=1 Tax=Zizania palustris TaxID=103762 RepID=A0A8J6BBX4_ZIZPA|nr:hypothetical protein GUJ93_ZPchr0010g8304 [Zizania palustris]
MHMSLGILGKHYVHLLMFTTFCIQMQHSLLKDITHESHSWHVRVRATRFSEYNSEDNPPVLLRLDFVIIDEEGTMMDAQIPGRHITTFKPILKEDRIYDITYFEVANARASYRPVDNNIMAKFTKYTKVKEITTIMETFPRYACKVVPFETLRARIDENKVLSDTVGMLIAISPVSMVRMRGIEKPVRNVQITDGRETLPVSLWGPHATHFDAEGLQAEANKQPVVMLFVGLTSKIRERQLTLYGSTICKWYSNPMIPEVVALQQSLSGKAHEITWFGQAPKKKQVLNATIHDIADLNPHDIMGNTYMVNIAIKRIIPGEPWWYMACDKCKRSASKDGTSYKCIRCGATQAEARYRLSIHGVCPSDLKNDDATNADFVFFGQIAEELIGIPALTLVASVQGHHDLVPIEITRLYGREMIVKVSASRRSLQMHRVSYQIESMSIITSKITDKFTPSDSTQLPMLANKTVGAEPSSTLNQTDIIEVYFIPSAHTHI